VSLDNVEFVDEASLKAFIRDLEKYDKGGKKSPTRGLMIPTLKVEQWDTFLGYTIYECYRGRPCDLAEYIGRIQNMLCKVVDYYD